MSKLDYLKKYMSGSTAKSAQQKKRVLKEEVKQDVKAGQWVPSSGGASPKKINDS